MEELGASKAHKTEILKYEVLKIKIWVILYCNIVKILISKSENFAFYFWQVTYSVPAMFSLHLASAGYIRVLSLYELNIDFKNYFAPLSCS